MLLTGGATDVTTYFVLRTAADGTATTGATITDIDLQYVRTGAAPSAKIDATALAAADSAHADNKAFEIDSTDAPGLYRVDWPDAAFVAGVKEVVLSVKLAGSFTEHLAVQIDPPVDVTKLAGVAQRATDLAEIAQYLFANGVTLTDIVADNSAFAQLAATDGDISGYSKTTDTQQAIRDAIAAAAPENFAPDASSVITTGTEDAGTFASCATDDSNRWTIGDANGANTIDVICEFNMGANRTAVELDVNGYFNRLGGGGYVVEMWAWNYTAASWDKLSSGTASTEMRDRNADADYLLSLHSGHTDRVTTPGEVKINFRSTRGTTAVGDVLYLDYVSIVGSAAAVSPDAIAAAVHEELDVHLTHTKNFTGEIRYVDTGGGSDANSGEYPHDAFATISAAITASSAGDMIVVKAGAYAEAVTLAAAGLELHCEIGTDITGAGGTPLTVSANGCKVIEAHLNPAAGQTGFIVSGEDGYFERLKSHASGATGFSVPATGQRNHFFDCVASEFTIAGFNIKGPNNVFDRCRAIGNGGTETGFHLSDTAAHRNVFDNCSTVDCATAGWDMDAGADDNMVVLSSDSVGCGARVDAGTNNAWRNFLDSDARLSSGSYNEGAIWIDTNASNTNTVSFVDGIATNPVSTLAAATTIAGNVNIKRFHLVPGSSITLAQAYNFYMFCGEGSTIALGGQSINGAVFLGPKITGNDDGSNTNRVRYFGCDISNNTLGQFIMVGSRFTGTLTLAEAGTYFMHGCYSGVAGTSAPVLDFGSGLNASNVNMRHYSGGIDIRYMGAGSGSYNMSLEGNGQLIINANCSATSTVAIRGNFTVTDNAGGAVTLSDDARYSGAAAADAVWDEAIAGHLGAGSTGATLNAASAPSAATVADAVWDEPNADHVAAGSTGKALSDLVPGSAVNLQIEDHTITVE